MGADLIPFAVRGLLAQFGKMRVGARQHYQQFVIDGIECGSIWDRLRRQIYLGDEKFVERMLQKAEMRGNELSIPLAQRRPPAPPLAKIAGKHRVRNDSILTGLAISVSLQI
jgi:hypothetical protein